MMIDDLVAWRDECIVVLKKRSKAAQEIFKCIRSGKDER